MKISFYKICVLALLVFLGISSISLAQNICQGEVVKLGLPPNALGGSIQWQESANGVTFTNISGQISDTLNLTVNSSGYYLAQITEGSCDPFYSDTIHIIMVTPPSPSNAGTDINVSGTSTTLNATSPVTGTGSWAIASGTGGTVANPSSPTSTFTGSANTTYQLTWTVTNPPCDPSVDTVNVTFGGGSSVPSITCNSQTLFVHPTDNSGPIQWGCIGQVAGASSDTDGQTNTSTIVSVCGTNTAANVCASLNAFGFSDWYLPAYDELDCMRNNAATIGGFSNDSYWSSTEGSGIFTANARYRTFPSGVSGFGTKSGTHRIRCVRK